MKASLHGGGKEVFSTSTAEKSLNNSWEKGSSFLDLCFEGEGGDYVQSGFQRSVAISFKKETFPSTEARLS